MKRLAMMLMIGSLALAGCDVLSPPTATPYVPPSTPMPTLPPLPTPTPGLALGGGNIDATGAFAAALLPEVPARFMFDGELFAAVTASATPQSEGLDVRLALRDFTHNALVTVDRGGPGVAETIPEVQLPVTGHYELTVEAVSGEGDVQGVLTTLAEPSGTGGGPLETVGEVSESLGRFAEGTFHALDVYHTYTVEVRRGMALVFEVTTTSDGVDPYFVLYDGQYSVLGIYDNEMGVNARSDEIYIEFDATYTLFVGNRGPNAGSYTVRVDTEG